jgi:hypothetical protein
MSSPGGCPAGKSRLKGRARLDRDSGVICLWRSNEARRIGEIERSAVQEEWLFQEWRGMERQDKEEYWRG